MEAARSLLPEWIQYSDDTSHYSVANLEFSSQSNTSVQAAASGWGAIKTPGAECDCMVLPEHYKQLGRQRGLIVLLAICVSEEQA